MDTCEVGNGNRKVYLLQHSYEMENGSEETKILGIFSSNLEAEKAIEKYKKLSGFKERPDDFYIDEYELNRKYWAEGYGV
ncbi:MAG: hypothetical protein NC092_12425 [Butyrivibrio sp.]|nr:hypothetical protein [Muribaculum sp.]MCM1553482.1 hypothetical protein [Butyrivibrio sp.]